MKVCDICKKPVSPDQVYGRIKKKLVCNGCRHKLEELNAIKML